MYLDDFFPQTAGAAIPPFSTLMSFLRRKERVPQVQSYTLLSNPGALLQAEDW